MIRFTRVWPAAPLAALAFLAPPLTARAQGVPIGRAPSSANSELSPTQRAHAEARQAQFKKDAAALIADKTLTDVQKRARYAVLAKAMDRDMLALLTPTQRAQVTAQREIGLQLQREAASLQADKTLTDAQKQTRYEALRQAANQKALATLPPAQRARAEKQQQAGEARKAEATRMGKELQASLSADQEKQVHAIGLASGTQVQAVIADKSLSQSAKVSKITAVREQAQTKINAILTPAQRTQYARLQALLTAPLPQ